MNEIDTNNVFSILRKKNQYDLELDR